MGKMEPIEGKQTSWAGLWWHPEYNGFSSESIDLADLRKFKGKVRLYVRKNKFFNGGEGGRPNYHFCLKAANSELFKAMSVEEGDSVFDKIEQLAEIMREGNRNADIAALPSESHARCAELMRSAIELVQDITGEEWNFTALTW